jgi:hypothetical protein
VETGVVGAGDGWDFGGARVETSTSEALVRLMVKTLRINKALGPLTNGSKLHDDLLRYIHTIFAQISQTAACNRAHSLSERLARWLY